MLLKVFYWYKSITVFSVCVNMLSGDTWSVHCVYDRGRGFCPVHFSSEMLRLSTQET